MDRSWPGADMNEKEKMPLIPPIASYAASIDYHKEILRVF
jgi:hypothetical protein